MNMVMAVILYVYIFMIVLVNAQQNDSDIIGNNTYSLAHCVYVDKNTNLFTLQNCTNFYYAMNFTDKSTNETYYFNPCENIFIQHNFSTLNQSGYFCKSDNITTTNCMYYYSFIKNKTENFSNMTELFRGKKDEKGEYIENPYILLLLTPGSVTANKNEIDENNLNLNLTMNITCSIKPDKLHSFFGENGGLLDASSNYLISIEDIRTVEREKTGNHIIRVATSLQCYYENYYIGNYFFYHYTITRFISGGIMLVIALYLLTIASKYHNATFILSGGLAYTYVLFSVVFNLCNTFRKVIFHNIIWLVIILLVGFVLGCLLGLILVIKKQTNLNIFIMNLGTGLMLSFFLFHIGLKYLDEHLDTTYWITIFVFSFSVALVAKYHQINNLFIIISSASVGGYLFVKSISIFLGSHSKFESDNIIADLSFWKEDKQLKENRSLITYFYLLGWVIISTVSAIFQRKFSSPIEDEQ